MSYKGPDPSEDDYQPRRTKYIVEWGVKQSANVEGKKYIFKRYIEEDIALLRIQEKFSWMANNDPRYPLTDLILSRMYEYNPDRDIWSRYPTKWDRDTMSLVDEDQLKKVKYMVEQGWTSGRSQGFRFSRYRVCGQAMRAIEKSLKNYGPGGTHSSSALVLNRVYEYSKTTDTWCRYPTQWDK